MVAVGGFGRGVFLEGLFSFPGAKLEVHLLILLVHVVPVSPVVCVLPSSLQPPRS